MNGLWTDVHVFDPDIYEWFGFVIIETITHKICDRASALEWNEKFAGLTELQMYPEEFTDEMMEIKKKNKKKWKGQIMRFYSEGSDEGFSRLMHSGLNPRKMVKAMPIDRGIYKIGMTAEKSRRKSDRYNLLTFTLNELHLGIEVLEKHADYIKSHCAMYGSSNSTNKKETFVPNPQRGYFNGRNSYRVSEFEFTLTDKQCTNIANRINKIKNTMSNALLIDLGDE